MPSYHVTGEHIDTGERVERTFRASSEADAKAFLNRERIAIQTLKNVSQDAAPEHARTPAPPITDPALLSELRVLRQDIRTQTELLDKTLNKNSSPFFTYLERRARMAVGCGLIVGAVLFVVFGVILAVLLPALGLALGG